MATYLNSIIDKALPLGPLFVKNMTYRLWLSAGSQGKFVRSGLWPRCRSTPDGIVHVIHGPASTRSIVPLVKTPLAPMKMVSSPPAKIHFPTMVATSQNKVHGNDSGCWVKPRGVNSISGPMRLKYTHTIHLALRCVPDSSDTEMNNTKPTMNSWINWKLSCHRFVIN